MPTKQADRTKVVLRCTSPWLRIVGEAAKAAGQPRATFMRALVSEGLKRRRYELPAMDMGDFHREPVTKRDKLRAKRRVAVAKWRAKQRAKAQGGITWLVYDATGLITTAELQALATSVGYVHPDGEYQPETTRYTVSTLLDVIRPRVESGELTDSRWPIFLARYSSP